MIATVLLKDLQARPLTATQLRNSIGRFSKIHNEINQSLHKKSNIEEGVRVEQEVLEDCQSEEYMEGLEKVESIKFENLGKVSNFTYKPDKPEEELPPPEEELPKPEEGLPQP